MSNKYEKPDELRLSSLFYRVKHLVDLFLVLYLSLLSAYIFKSIIQQHNFFEFRSHSARYPKPTRKLPLAEQMLICTHRLLGPEISSGKGVGRDHDVVF